MKKLVVVLFTLLFMGCSTQTCYVNGQANSSIPTQEVMQPFFVDGIGQKQAINAAEVCYGAENVAKVESQQSFLNIVLSTITFGIYTPRQAKVYCMQ